jgi:hypothetical protein
LGLDAVRIELAGCQRKRVQNVRQLRLQGQILRRRIVSQI